MAQKSNNEIILEACVETFQQAITAFENGASRLELCSNLEVGGTTPDFKFVEEVMAAVKIPVVAMIRPRAGNFVYSEGEFDQMKDQINRIREIGCQGVVFGILTPEWKIDIQRTKALVNHSNQMQVTFHKAFDKCTNHFDAILTLKEIGVDRVLTSGGEDSALKGSNNLKRLIEFCGNVPKIIVAGGVTHDNLETLKQLIGNATEFHGRNIVRNL